MSNIQILMEGRWREALIQLGVPAMHLDGRNRPCPLCGGKDRFCFNDKNGRGLWYCRGCKGGGGGDGVKLAMAFTGMTFEELAKELEDMYGNAGPAPQRRDNSERKRQYMEHVWNESRQGGLLVGRYLRSRGITGPIPLCLREHPRLDYNEKQGDKWVTLGHYPAMIAKIVADGRAVGLHRTYLDPAGGKAPVETPKKSVGELTEGALIPLHRPMPLIDGGARLGLAEGIETALAASVLFDVPAWATISAGGMERALLPPEITEVWIFADNDPSRTGLAAATALARRLIVREKRTVKIYLPVRLNIDFADIASKRFPNEYLVL